MLKPAPCLSAILVSALIAAADAPVADAQFAFDTEDALASVFARRGLQVIGAEPLTSADIQLARMLFELAIEMDPDDPELRRQYLSLARLAEDQELRRSIVADLSSRDSADEVLRLERITDALDRFQTADQLAEAYDRLLTDANVRSLGGAVSSRLALDAALLYDRLDQPEAFAQWLGRATAWDQSNKAAAGWVAGFVRMQLDDPFAQGELLVNLLMADPADVTAQSALARHLLEHGAYQGATRLYRLAARMHEAVRRFAGSDLVADLALALWGSGDAAGAKAVIRQRQIQLNEIAQGQALQADPTLSPIDRSRITAPTPASLAAIHLAILVTEQDPSQEKVLADFLANVDLMLAQADPAPGPADLVEALVASAWLQLCFGKSLTDAESRLDRANAIAPLTPQARSRFDGWIALRRGEVSRASELLAPLAPDDPMAAAGMAMIALEAGDQTAAARFFGDVARAVPGNVLGVWARKRLESMIGEPVAHSDVARRLETLVTGVPSIIEAIPTEPSRLVSLHVEPLQRTHRPFAPIPVRISITNNCSFPVGIGLDAPIQRILLIETRLIVSNRPSLTTTSPIALDIGRRLRLNPHERLEIVIDLQRTPAGDLIQAIAYSGCGIELRATLNFMLLPGNNIEPGALGVFERTESFRIDGVRVSAEWLDGAMAAIAEPDTSDDLVTLALLAQMMNLQAVRPETYPALAPRMDAFKESMAIAFSKLQPLAQAWLVGTTLRGDVHEPLRQLARSSADELVQIAYLTGHVGEADDPMLDAAIRGENERLRLFAETLRTVIQERKQINDMAAEAARGTTPPGAGNAPR